VSVREINIEAAKLMAIVAVLKGRFAHLTAEDSIKIAFDIYAAVMAATPPEHGPEEAA
jgi:hypothetical protein